jgi:hypothetical protein
MALLWNLFAASPMSRLCLRQGIAATEKLRFALQRSSAEANAA